MYEACHQITLVVRDPRTSDRKEIELAGSLNPDCFDSRQDTCEELRAFNRAKLVHGRAQSEIPKPKIVCCKATGGTSREVQREAVGFVEVQACDRWPRRITAMASIVQFVEIKRWVVQAITTGHEATP